MSRPATPRDISAILDRLEAAPMLGEAFRTDPALRLVLGEMGQELAERLGSPRSEVERSLSAQVQAILGRG